MGDRDKIESLIKDRYNKSKEGNLIGIIYGAVFTYTFNDVLSGDCLLNGNLDLLYLKSRLTDFETQVYSWELEDYTIKEGENTIYIKLKNKPEIALIY